MKLHGKFCWKLKISLLNWQKTNKYLFRQVFFCLRTDEIFFTKFCKSHFLPIRYLLCLSLFFLIKFSFSCYLLPLFILLEKIFLKFWPTNTLQHYRMHPILNASKSIVWYEKTQHSLLLPGIARHHETWSVNFSLLASYKTM